MLRKSAIAAVLLALCLASSASAKVIKSIQKTVPVNGFGEATFNLPAVPEAIKATLTFTVQGNVTAKSKTVKLGTFTVKSGLKGDVITTGDFTATFGGVPLPFTWAYHHTDGPVEYSGGPPTPEGPAAIVPLRKGGPVTGYVLTEDVTSGVNVTFSGWATLSLVYEDAK